jgi:hypothetical protein
MNLTRSVCWAGLIGFALIPAAQGDDLAQEYSQVRKIALKDPKVRAAFERAYEKLNKRIIEIDPALKPFVERQGAGKKSSEAARKSSHQVSPRANIHIVAKGETLTSISKRYKVSVDSLTRVNHFAKGSTLQVGQKLAIPSVPARVR